MAFIVREEGKIRLVGMPEPEQNEGASSGIVSSLIGAGMEALAAKKAQKNEKPIVRSPSPKPKATAKPAEESLKNPPKQKRNSYSDGGPKTAVIRILYGGSFALRRLTAAALLRQAGVPTSLKSCSIELSLLLRKLGSAFGHKEYGSFEKRVSRFPYFDCLAVDSSYHKAPPVI